MKKKIRMHLFSKISLTILFVLTASLIAEILGFISKKNSDYIFLIGLSIQILLFIIILISYTKQRDVLKRGVKIIRYKTENRFIKGNTDVLPSFISSTNPRKASIFKIFFEADKCEELPYFGILKIGKGNIGPDDLKKHLLNLRSGIMEESFIFDADILVKPDEKINFKFKDDINIKFLFIGEIYMP